MNSIDVSFKIDDISFFLKLATPNIIFVEARKYADFFEALQKLNKSIEIIVVDGDVEGCTNFATFLVGEIEQILRFRPYNVKSLKENCAIFFSSGTSGYPKPICLSHSNLLYQVAYAS